MSLGPLMVLNVHQSIVGVFPSQWSAFDTAFSLAPSTGPQQALLGP